MNNKKNVELIPKKVLDSLSLGERKSLEELRISLEKRFGKLEYNENCPIKKNVTIIGNNGSSICDTSEVISGQMQYACITCDYRPEYERKIMMDHVFRRK